MSERITQSGRLELHEQRIAQLELNRDLDKRNSDAKFSKFDCELSESKAQINDLNTTVFGNPKANSIGLVTLMELLNKTLDKKFNEFGEQLTKIAQDKAVFDGQIGIIKWLIGGSFISLILGIANLLMLISK